ncbi:hypothetical protein [Candidatus Amarolinea dominans]|uniref:hypothetical protein n=1 Tax=Candidatus Amarolinea dominans TaxID=3140696 RepID=UPI0031361EB6|nr:hypothetical protein [Anaerolineae bacterium]
MDFQAPGRPVWALDCVIPRPGGLTRGLDEPVNDAAAYGVGIEETQPENGSLYWRVHRVHHLTPEENNFSPAHLPGHGG